LKHPSVLFIGNFFLGVSGGKCASEELVDQLLRSSDWNIITTPFHFGRIKRLVDIINTILAKRSIYDVACIEVYSGLAFIWAEISAFLLYWMGKPLILSLHGGGLPALAARSPGRLKRLFSSASIVTTPSLYLQHTLKFLRNDIHYLPNGISLSQYLFLLRSDPAPQLCWLRAFHQIYNPLMAVKVVARLQKKFPDIHLAMIGADKGDGSFEQVVNFVQENDLEKCVFFFSAIPKKEVPSRLQKYDIFINTTNLESFGVAVMEAAALGLPIITTNVGELSYLWSNDQDALLVPRDDADAMANAVERILTEAGLAERLSRNARQKAGQFDWPEILPRWKQLIHQAAGDKPTWQ